MAGEDNDPFADILSRRNEPSASPVAPPSGDPFASILGGKQIDPTGTSATGSFARGAEQGAAPAVGGLAGAGAGAAAGAAIGEAVFPLGGGVPGAFIGGVVGGLGGSYGTAKAQDYALQQAPEAWKEKLGLDERQQQLDQQFHPYASFLGGMAPFALTMRPGPLAATKLPANATALQRIMADPVTARVFGGAVMGGMEMGQEIAGGQSPSWAKVAIATGFGVVLNKPNAIGERIEGLIPSLFRRAPPLAAPVVPLRETDAPFQPRENELDPYFSQLHDELTQTPASNADVPGVTAPRLGEDLGLRGLGNEEGAFISSDRTNLEPTVVDWDALHFGKMHDIMTEDTTGEEGILGLIAPTTAQAGDFGIMGTGFDEEAFFRNTEPPRAAVEAARDTARQEQEILGKPFKSVDLTARAMHPEVFEEYDSLHAQRESLRAQIRDASNPPDETVAAANARATDLQKQLADTIEKQKGYEGGPEARRLRAQIRDAVGQVADLMERRKAFEEGRGKDTAEVTALRGHFAAVDAQLRDVSRQVAAARIRAAEGIGAKTIEPVPLPKERVAEPPKAVEETKPEPIVEPPAKSAKAPKAKAAEPIIEPPPPPASDLVAAPAPAAGEEPPIPVNAPPRTIEQQRGFIEDDVRKKLIAAGRTPEEAEASAKLTSALYETHAERTGGNAEDIYRADGPNIKLSKALSRAFGKLTIVDGRKIIKLAKDANATTFIHELGHDWLERIVRDADLANASSSLKDDAATIKKWLGHSDGEIKTVAHEKFARGFERYLFEGAAPNARLASVFAKFKNWMAEVYRTIKGVSTPEAINPDIRAVFDRMLTGEPERTSIVAEHEPGPSLADIHEADAEHVEPEEADAAADRVAAERARYEQDMPPEVEHELNPFLAASRALAGDETGAGGAGRGEVARPGGDARPKSPNGGVGGGRGAVGESRSAAKTESSGASGGGSAAAGSESHPLAGTPAATFGEGATFNVGKDHNVRVENITSKEQFVQAINEAADRVGGGGPMTMGDMLDAQQEFLMAPGSITEASLARSFGGVKDLNKKLWALRVAIRDQTAIVNDLMTNARESGDEAAYGRLAIEIAKHDMMYATLSSVTTETGRGLGMGFRNLDEWSASKNLNELSRAITGRDLFQLKQIAELGKNLKTPGQVSKFLRDAQKRTFGKMIFEFFINNLISGPATHVTYTIGNEALLLNKMGLETPVAAAIGKLRAAMGREGERVYAGEATAGLAEHVRSLPRALQSAIEGFKTGRTTLLPGEQGRPLTPFAGDEGISAPARTSTNADVTWREAQADAFGLIQGMRDGVSATAALVGSGGEAGAPAFGLKYSPAGFTPDIAIKGVTVPLGSAIRLPSRFVAAIHSFFRTMNYSIENNGGAWRQATSEGLTGMEHSARVAELRQNPSDASMEKSRTTANDLTLMGQGGAFVDHLSKLMNWSPNLPILGETPVLKFIDPFVHIAANVIDQTLVHRTPVGLLSESIRADIFGKNGNIAQDMAQARMLVGTAMATLFGGLAASGYMTGTGPVDPSKNAVWRQAGNQAHSIRIGDTWYDVHRMGPLGMLAGISADMYDVIHIAAKGDTLNAGAMLVHAFAQNVLDESFMKGPAEWIQAVQDPGRYGERVIKEFAASFVPWSVGLSQVNRAVDPYTRMTRTVMDAIKQKIPGMSETLSPRIDIWGEPIPNHDALLAAGLTAIYEQKISQDPVNIALAQLGVGVAPVPKSIRNVLLDDKQYEDFARIAGVVTKQRLDVIVNSPDWNTWPTHVKIDVFNEVKKQSREAARGMMFSRYPQIVADATKAALAKHQDPPEDEQ